MGQLGSSLTLYRSALKMQDEKKPKKGLPAWTKQDAGTVAKPNLFLELEKKSIQKTPPNNQIINRNKMIKSMSTQDRDKAIDYYKTKMREVKNPTSEKQPSIFKTLEKKTNIKVSQNASDFMPEEKLKVKPKYQNRVNKILGK